MTILMIRLIFLAVSTFVFSNKANILDSALRKCLFCHCRRLKVRKILLVQSQIVDLKIQMRHPSSHRYCFLLLKMPQFLYLFPRIAVSLILYLSM